MNITVNQFDVCLNIPVRIFVTSSRLSLYSCSYLVIFSIIVFIYKILGSGSGIMKSFPW